MSKITIQNNTIIWPISRGISESISIVSSSGWAQYDSILMDIKSVNNLDPQPLLSLSISNGLTITDQILFISLTYQQTSQFVAGNLYADIKLKIGDLVTAKIPFLISVSNSVTKVA